jgi:hypothetical protein
MIGKRNKIVGRDLTKEKLQEIALKYKSRGEFQLLDGSAYTTARIAGSLDEICKHMISQSFSIPQLILRKILELILKEKLLYNSRKIISPYELDIFIPDYNLAFEYDGKGWHKNNTNDEIKNELCLEKNIKLIRIVENNRNYIEDIKNQLILNLNIINDHCNKSIIEKDINKIENSILNDYINKYTWSEDNILEIVNKYDNIGDFVKDQNSLYNKILKSKQLEKYTSHMSRKHINWIIETIKIEIEKYEYLQDFYEKSYGCYLHVKRNKLDYLLSKLKTKRKTKWSYEEIVEIVKQKEYKTTYQLRKYYAGAYRYLIKNNRQEEIRKVMTEI